jgi:hypothetical protein
MRSYAHCVQTCTRSVDEGPRPNGRKIDAPLLPPLRCLHEQTTGLAWPPETEAPTHPHDALEHGVGAFRSLDGKDLPTRDNTSLPDIERRQCREKIARPLQIILPFGRERRDAALTWTNQNPRRNNLRRKNLKSFFLKHRNDSPQQMIVAATKQTPDDLTFA